MLYDDLVVGGFGVRLIQGRGARIGKPRVHIFILEELGYTYFAAAVTVLK